MSQSQEEEKAASLIQSQIFHSSVVMSPWIVVILLFIVFTWSYTAFLDGACVVSQSQELPYAVSLITPAAELHAVVSTYALIILF